MRNQLFSGAIGIMLLFGSILPAAAQSPVQIYGRVITSLNHTKTGNGATKLDLEENGSKLGFRGG